MTYSQIDIPVKKKLLGVGITNETRENILEFILKTLKNTTKPYYIVTPNPEMIVLAHHNNDFKSVLNNATIALNDGVGLGFGARILGMSLHARFTGVEFVEKTCEKVANWPITVGFLGAGPRVAEITAECLKKKYPGLHVAFAQEEWPHEKNKQKKIDILFIAFGFPKQEFWMDHNVGKIPVKVMVGVGGAFDYISGKVPRAPRVVRSLGFEWLFRLVIQPWRFKRQLGLFEFVWMIIKEKLHNKRP